MRKFNFKNFAFNFKDVKYVRVDFISIPFYDDHFDIIHESWKLGAVAIL